MTDGWRGYLWLDSINSDFIHLTYIHASNAFGEGIQSTSHVESLWVEIKNEIKYTYKMIPSTNLLYFIKEAEWKIKTKSLNYGDKLDDFFDMYNLVGLVGEFNILNEEVFLKNDEINI